MLYLNALNIIFHQVSTFADEMSFDSWCIFHRQVRVFPLITLNIFSHPLNLVVCVFTLKDCISFCLSRVSIWYLLGSAYALQFLLVIIFISLFLDYLKASFRPCFYFKTIEYQFLCLKGLSSLSWWPPHVVLGSPMSRLIGASVWRQHPSYSNTQHQHRHTSAMTTTSLLTQGLWQPHLIMSNMESVISRPFDSDYFPNSHYPGCVIKVNMGMFPPHWDILYNMETITDCLGLMIF